MPRQLHLVAYDVTDPKRLRLALSVVRDYALGGQKSVFECFLSQGEQRELRQRLDDVIDPDDDRFLILRLDPRGATRTLGRGRAPVDPRWFYVG